MKCVVCGNKVHKFSVYSMYTQLFDRARKHGDYSLSKNEQLLVSWQCCRECYEQQLKTK